MKEEQLKKLREPLPLSEVELRVGNVKEGSGFSLLAYKTARVDRYKLDEVIGAMNWQNKHYVDSKGNVVCSIGVYDEDKKEWIWKEDTGSESYTEKEKGSYSDSFKRAGFRWGIGVELYDMPFIWVKWDKWRGKIPDVNLKSWLLQKDEKDGGYYIIDKTGMAVWDEKGLYSPRKSSSPAMPTPPKTKEVDDFKKPENIADVKGEIISIGKKLIDEKIHGFETTEKFSQYCKERNPKGSLEGYKIVLKQLKELSTKRGI